MLSTSVCSAITSWEILLDPAKNLRRSENAPTSTSNPLVTVTTWLLKLLGYLALVRCECVRPSVGNKAARCSDQDSAGPNGVNTAVALDLELQQAPEAAESLCYHKGEQRTAYVTGGILRWGCLDESTVVDLCIGNKAIA